MARVAVVRNIADSIGNSAGDFFSNVLFGRPGWKNGDPPGGIFGDLIQAVTEYGTTDKTPSQKEVLKNRIIEILNGVDVMVDNFISGNFTNNYQYSDLPSNVPRFEGFPFEMPDLWKITGKVISTSEIFSLFDKDSNYIHYRVDITTAIHIDVYKTGIFANETISEDRSQITTSMEFKWTVPAHTTSIFLTHQQPVLYEEGNPYSFESIKSALVPYIQKNGKYIYC